MPPERRMPKREARDCSRIMERPRPAGRSNLFIGSARAALARAVSMPKAKSLARSLSNAISCSVNASSSPEKMLKLPITLPSAFSGNAITDRKPSRLAVSRHSDNLGSVSMPWETTGCPIRTAVRQGLGLSVVLAQPVTAVGSCASLSPAWDFIHRRRSGSCFA